MVEFDFEWNSHGLIFESVVEWNSHLILFEGLMVESESIESYLMGLMVESVFE